MENFNLHAYVLKATQCSDSKWRIVFFSKERGRLMAWFRMPKKQLSSVDPFVPLWLSIQSRTSGHAVDKIERLAANPPIQGEALFAGWYLNELMLMLMPEEDANPELFIHYDTTLKALGSCDTRARLEVVLRQFEWKCLQLIGYGIDLTHDARSGRPIQPDKCYQCLPQLGLIEASSGIPGQLCLNLAQGQTSSSELQRAEKQLTRMLIDHALGGRELKTRALFRSLYAPTH